MTASPEVVSEVRPGVRTATGEPGRAGLIATLSAVIVYLIASDIETLLINVLQPTELELAWISDAVLALAFGSAVFLWLHLKWTRESLSQLERQHIVIDAQLAFAAQIQRELLPAVPPEEPGIAWGARLVPAGSVGGDIYDIVRIGETAWLVLIADVSGKGVPAALVLASIRTMFRMLTSETHDPGNLLERISRRLYEDHRGLPYLTAVVLQIDSRQREFSYANAGHPDGLVFDPANPHKTPMRIASSGPPAGLFPEQSYQTLECPLPARALTVLTTDGITDALDLLGTSNISAIAHALSASPLPVTPRQVCDALIEQTAPALENGQWQDDRTVVAIALG